MVYAAQTLSLAVLETAAHLQDAGIPLNRFVVDIDVPSEIWKARVKLSPAVLDQAWSAIPSGQASERAGSQWYQSRASVLLLVPSVIVPEEFAVLINSSHPDAGRLVARVVRRFEYNRLFRG